MKMKVLIETGRKNRWARDILEIVVAFAAAWIFYQGLAFAAGTSTPIVSVASQSMYHTKNLDEWWQERSGYYESIGIGREDFMAFQNRYGLDKGDILFVISGEHYRAGDIVVYHPGKGCFYIEQTIVHRIVQAEDGRYVTKGDNNPTADKCPVEKAQIEGKAVLAVPLLGYPRLAIEPILQGLSRK